MDTIEVAQERHDIEQLSGTIAPDIDVRIRQAFVETSLMPPSAARRAGITISYLDRLMNGESKPSLQTLRQIARGWNHDIERFLV